MSRAITQLLLAWRRGEPDAQEKLCPLVYDQLRRLARSYMRQERPGHTLRTTALVHEAWLRLAESPRIDWQNRTQFFALSAQLMRRVLVDYARRHRAQKRGGAAPLVSWDEALELARHRSDQLVALDDALRALAAFDARKARVVELRFFGGLSVEEAAQALEISPDTVLRDWKLAKAWLRRELSRAKHHAS
jgi:RNA polymerase sigma factor (TIGR02999 family)